MGILSFLKKAPAREWVLRFCPKGGAAAEVGVWKGDFSEKILQRQPRELHLIDPWIHIGDVPGRLHAAPQQDMDAICEGVRKRFEHERAVRIHRCLSSEAAPTFADGSLDWVYVDGNHSYEFVIEDLRLWFPKLRPGGHVCGDDFMENPKLQWGVVRAVEEFVASHGLTLDVSDNQFAIRA